MVASVLGGFFFIEITQIIVVVEVEIILKVTLEINEQISAVHEDVPEQERSWGPPNMSRII